MSLLRALTQPKILVPLLLSAALLSFLLTITDLPKVVERIRGIPISAMALSFVLAIAYLALKGSLFHYFLENVQIHTAWRQSLLAFSVGEMTLTLPAGIYAQNYVLRRIAGADFSISAAATTALLASEAAVSLAILAILGIPGFYWLRPAVVAFFAAAAFAATALIKIETLRNLAGQALRAGPLRTVGPELIELAEGLRELFVPEVVARAVLFTVPYLLSLVSAFHIVAHGVGFAEFSLEQAVTVYLFALAVELLFPLSTNLGVIEGAGLVAMQAWGYDSTAAIAMLLGFRLVWTGSIWIACMTTLVLLWSEFEARR